MIYLFLFADEAETKDGFGTLSSGVSYHNKRRLEIWLENEVQLFFPNPLFISYNDLRRRNGVDGAHLSFYGNGCG